MKHPGVTRSVLAQTSAVVVGACAHGLAVIRALACEGLDVHVLEADRGLPGTRTCRAKVHWCDDINRYGLIKALLELADTLARPEAQARPVLFLTNDNMVRQVADHWNELAGRYLLSWSSCIEETRRQLQKSAHEQHAGRVGIGYPRSYLVHQLSDLADVSEGSLYPMIAKPVKPLSGFKVRKLEALADLQSLVATHEADLPFLVQQWIPGGDENIHFCALYLHEGQVLARFDGRKLRSRPMGHTTIAISSRKDDVYALARRYFDALQLSGPVSIEFKRDDRGQYWLMEPTVGRTDFWIDVCVSNGVNLPYVEYLSQTGRLSTPVPQSEKTVWLNTQRDPLSPFWFLRFVMSGLTDLRRPVFPFFRWGDLGPFGRGLIVFVKEEVFERVLARASRHFRRAERRN